MIFNAEAIKCLQVLESKVGELIVIFKVKEETQKVVILKKMMETKFTRLIKESNFLFCSTNEGPIHIVRQIEPLLHIDTKQERVFSLQKHIANVFSLFTSPQIQFPSNVRAFESVSSFLEFVGE